MTTSHLQTISTSARLNNFVAEAFQVATIALVGVVGILTVAATI
ncbi:MAG TPA: hypothetical protein VMO78_10960 [Rhizomicrobium sp.]|nr:hypothetical protein [Rhizomicrobium sp.]